MAELSSILFPIGVVLVALAFAAHVGHAVMLANGRLAIARGEAWGWTSRTANGSPLK